MIEITTMIIDVIEGDMVCTELPDGRYIDFPIAWLPPGIAEGDHLRVESDGDGRVTFTIDRDATDAARRAAQEAIDAITDEPPEDFNI
jgi:hypothetical protein